MKAAWLAVLGFALGLALFPAPAAARPPKTDPLVEQVRRAIQDGVKFLRGKQMEDGSWEIYNIATLQPGGTTALAMLALLTAGVSPNDRAIQRGLAYLRKLEPRHTYVRALQTMVFVEAGKPEDLERIQRNVNWLIDARVMDGKKLLGWTYTKRGDGLGGRAFPDNSNTQYAVLGLHAGHLAGARIPQEVWKSILEYYETTQTQGGGWIYNGRTFSSPYLTMTTAGLCGLLIAGLEMNKGREKPRGDGTWENCGKYEENPTAKKALNWIGNNFTVEMPYRIYYNLYGLERVGRLSGLRFLGQHDWYREGCKYLVSKQSRDDGSWPRAGQFDQWPAINTSFALLFLAKGRTPVLISKMVHGPGEDWNNDRNDAKHLTEFVSQQLFRHQPLAWQVFDAFRALDNEAEGPDKLDHVTAELLQSPVVYFNGHQAPEFKDSEIDLLKKYVDNGGFIFAEACCGRKEFDQGFKVLVKKLFPHSTLQDVEPSHPVWSAYFKVDPNKFPLKCIKSGCKTVLIYSPHDLSCYWESNNLKDADTLQAFRLGANVIAYATGLEMPKPRLSEQTVIRNERKAVPRDAIKVAQVNYGPDWQPAPNAMHVLMDYVEKEAGVRVDDRTEEIGVDSRDIMRFKFIYMHGGKKFAIDNGQLEGFRRNLEEGGATLFADACCGSEAFDQSFRRFMKQLFPNHKLEPIPVKDPLFGEDLNGEQIDERNIRCRTQRPDGQGAAPYRPMAPALEGIKINNRWVVIYSKYDIGCALEKHQSTDCLGYDHPSALRLGMAAVLYALKQ